MDLCAIFQTKETKGCKWGSYYLGELESIEKWAYYTRDVYILGQFVNVQKSFFAFGFTKCISYVD